MTRIIINGGVQNGADIALRRRLMAATFTEDERKCLRVLIEDAKYGNTVEWRRLRACAEVVEAAIQRQGG